MLECRCDIFDELLNLLLRFFLGEARTPMHGISLVFCRGLSGTLPRSIIVYPNFLVTLRILGTPSVGGKQKIEVKVSIPSSLVAMSAKIYCKKDG